MKLLLIDSKAYGTLKVKVDDENYETLFSMRRWTASKDRGKYYFHKRISKKDKITMHRFIVKCPKGMYVDHINGDTLDNRKNNLRICTNSSNIRNGKVRKNNKSGTTGVGKVGKKWEARIRVKYNIIILGRFLYKKDAINARKIAEKKYWYI